MSFFLYPVMFFSLSAMAFVTGTRTAVICWKTKQGCNKMTISVCIMQVMAGVIGYGPGTKKLVVSFIIICNSFITVVGF